MEITKNYIAHIDSKKRITLKEASHEYYNVKVCENGCIILAPLDQAPSVQISERTLRDMDQAIETIIPAKSQRLLIFQISEHNVSAFS